MFLFIAIILMTIRVLAWAGLLFGIIFFVLGNSTKGIELFLVGILLTILKYFFGFIIAIVVEKDYS